MSFLSGYSILFIVLSLLSALTFSFFYYRKTKISGPPKLLLICIRATAVFLFLSLLFISYITLTAKSTSRPKNIFLIDYSSSMRLENRMEDLKKSIETIKKIKNSESENRYYLFADDIIKEIDLKEFYELNDVNANIGNTNLSKSLNTIFSFFENETISSVNIISDGIINTGGNPIYSAGTGNILYNYFLIGDTVQRKDLSIKNIFFNSTSYTESNTQILTEINSYNLNKPVKISLFEDDKLIHEKNIDVNDKNIIYNCSFDVKSKTVGIIKYTVKLENQQDEITEKNNIEKFFIEYISNKFKILVISGNPSPDFSYLKESMKKINNFESEFLTQKSPGIFYEGQLPALYDFNSLILINYPNASTDLNSLFRLKEELDKINLPVFFISGSNTDYERLKILYNFLPFSNINKIGNEEKTSIKIINDLSNNVNKFFGFSSPVNNLPEITIPGINFSLTTGSEAVILSGKSTKPILIFDNNSGRNSAALLAYNFFRWRLNNTYSESKDFLTEILPGIILSISNKEKNKKILIKTEKQIYSPYEKIQVKGEINTDEPINLSLIKSQVYNNTITKDIEVSRTGGNNFSGEIGNLAEGEYVIKCSLLKDGIEIANDVKKIIVKESNMECKETKAENNILANLSISSGGIKFSGEGISEINEKLKTKNEKDILIRTNKEKVYLNSSVFLLLFIIFLFSIEWFFRKRMNLP